MVSSRVAKNIKRRLILWIFILACSQNWLHIPLVIATLVTSQNWPKAKTLPMCESGTRLPWSLTSVFRIFTCNVDDTAAVCCRSLATQQNLLCLTFVEIDKGKDLVVPWSCGRTMRVLRGTFAPTPATFAGGLASCRILLLPEEPYMKVFF